MNPAFLIPVVIISLSGFLWINLKLKKFSALKIILNVLISGSAIFHTTAAIILITKKPAVFGLGVNAFLRLWLNYPEYNLTLATGFLSICFLLIRSLRKKVSIIFLHMNMTVVFGVNYVLELRMLANGLSAYFSEPSGYLILSTLYQAVHCAIVVGLILIFQLAFRVFRAKN